MKGKFTMRTQQFSASRALFFALLVVTFLMGVPKGLWATSILPTEFEVTEMMMEAQVAEVGVIARLFGLDPTPLSFTSMVDVTSRSFSFDIDHGSTYSSSPITVSASGGFNSSTGLYEWTSAGKHDLFTWIGSGVGDPDPGIDIEWKIKDPVFGTVLFKLDLKASGDINVVIRDDKVTGVTSKWDYDFTLDGKTQAKGKGTDKYENEKWSIKVSGLPGNLGILASGFSPQVGGAGFSTAVVIPEPSTLTLFGIGLAGLVRFRFRKKRA